MKIVCLDFDGVIHLNVSRWRGVETIPEKPVEGAKEAIEWLRRRFVVKVYSGRCGYEGGREAIEKWLDERKLLLMRYAKINHLPVYT